MAVSPRRANALSKLSFAGLLRLDGNRIADIRLAFGAVAPTVVRSREIEGRMSGRTLASVLGSFEEIRSAYGDLIRPIDDQRSTAAYRRETALRLLESFLRGGA